MARAPKGWPRAVRAARSLVRSVAHSWPREDTARRLYPPDGARLVSSSLPALSSAEPSLPALSLEPHGLAFIQHSAGTTGFQKGVALSHGAVLTQLHHLVTALKVSDQDRIYSWLPLYHDMGLIGLFTLPMVHGIDLVLASPQDFMAAQSNLLNAEVHLMLSSRARIAEATARVAKDAAQSIGDQAQQRDQ